MQIVSFPVLILVSVIGTILMLVLSTIVRRFGWKGQLGVILLIALIQVARDRVWFTVFLPVMTFDLGVVPFLSAVAIYAAGLSLGLLSLKSSVAEIRVARLLLLMPHSAAEVHLVYGCWDFGADTN